MAFTKNESSKRNITVSQTNLHPVNYFVKQLRVTKPTIERHGREV